MKNNRLKVIVNDGLGNITEKNFTNIHDANKYHNAMHKKLFLTNNRANPSDFILAELKIMRLHHEI
jgi:hypothetical protein